MVRLVLAFAVSALTILSVLSLDARLAGVQAALSFDAPHVDDVADCTNGSGDTAIRACSRIINSERMSGAPISKENLAIIYSNLGDAVSGLGQFDKAISSFTTAVNLDPKNVSILNSRGWNFYRKKNYDRAIQDFNQVIQLEPKNPSAFRNRANAYARMGNFRRAHRDFDKAIQLDPEFSEAISDKAWRLATAPDIRFRNGQQALKLANRAIALRDHAYHRRALAAAFAEVGRFSDAVREAKAAISMLELQFDREEFQRMLAHFERDEPYRE